MSSLIRKTPHVRPRRRRSAREENKMRDAIFDAIISAPKGMIVNVLPGGTTMWPSVRYRIYSGGGTVIATAHSHSSAVNYGFAVQGLCGPD